MATSPGRSQEDRLSRKELPPTDFHGAYRLALAEAVLLQVQDSPDRVAQVGGRVLQATLGPVTGCLFYRATDKVSRLEPIDGAGRRAAAPSPEVIALLEQAVANGAPVSHESRLQPGMAVPLTAGSEVIGAFFIEGASCRDDQEHSLSDLLSLLGSHLGSALWRTLHQQEISGALSLRKAKEAFERDLVCKSLKEARGNISLAARHLSVDRGQLSRLVKKYGIDRAQFENGAATLQ